jgi:uroporphyrinogen-III decarboxylase
MTRRERLMATLQGKPVDRPAVSFYEIGGWKMEPDGDEFTVWNDPSWGPLVEMAHAETDLIRLMGPGWKGGSDGGLAELTATERWREGDSLFTRTTIRAPGRALTSLTRRDKSTQTVWTVEHLLKSAEDAEAYLQLPDPTVGAVDASRILAEEAALGDAGIVSIESADPICAAASLFSMEEYTVIALTEPGLFHRLLERFARSMFEQCEQTARALPGRLWRICGSEYAGEPYLPPRLYGDYVERYTGQMVRTIQKHGGYARIHSHGRLRGIMPSIARMKPDGLDPLEPPPQGDMELWQIREAIGRDTVLMGNIEAADIENLPPPEFERKVATALREGTAGAGRGFILHPSSCPYGRTITERTMTNYRTMIRLARHWGS